MSRSSTCIKGLSVAALTLLFGSMLAGCGDDKGATTGAAATPPEQTQANQNMEDFVKSQKAAAKK